MRPLNPGAAEWCPQSAAGSNDQGAAVSSSRQVAIQVGPEPNIMLGPVQHLAQFFPQFSDHVLQRVLAAAAGDVSAAANELSAADYQDISTSARPTAEQLLKATSNPELPQDEATFPSLIAAGTCGTPSTSTIPPRTQPLGSSWRGAALPVVKQPPPFQPASRPQLRQATDAGPAPSLATGTTAASIAWVETGSTVSQQYKTARDTATTLARARNVCFEQATLAYQTGNKALAKELGAKGRVLNERMKAEHEAASAVIFSSRNSASAANFETAGDHHVVDLHGLHVPEAVQFLGRQVDVASLRQTPVSLYVLVGTGHHTKGIKTPARLPAAVAAYLDHRRIRYEEPQPGQLKITLPSPSQAA